MIFYRWLFLLTFWCSAHSFASEEGADKGKGSEAYIYMDSLALKAGTDKSSAFHNYTKVYAKYFKPLQNKSINFLEIGIAKGNSVKLWEWYFPKAELHFMDITNAYIEYKSARSHYHFIDQADFAGQQAFAQTVDGFDIIIDDGGHRMEQQITSFLALFPYVKSGGMYIIEDLHTSYWQSYGSYGSPEAPQSGPGTCVDFLQKLVDDLNYTAARTLCANFDKISPQLRSSLTYTQANIDSIHFYQSLCIIIKK